MVTMTKKPRSDKLARLAKIVWKSKWPECADWTGHHGQKSQNGQKGQISQIGQTSQSGQKRQENQKRLKKGEWPEGLW